MRTKDLIRQIIKRKLLTLYGSKKVYRNLVFKGGGVRGVAYMGALSALEEAGKLENIERTAGTSAGAIAALIFSFRMPVSDMLDIFNDLDLSKVPQHGDETKGILKKIPPLKGSDSYLRLLDKFGWYSSDYFYCWEKKLIAAFCGGNEKTTFRDFRKLGYRDIHVVAANLSRQQEEVFSADRTPDVAVADAVRLSMSIPLFFESLQYDGEQFGMGDYYVDGGLYNNYPIHLFDHERYVESKSLYSDGINWETLGLFLYPSSRRKLEARSDPKNLWEYIGLTVKSLYDSQQTSALDHNPIDHMRSICINDCGISSLDFDISKESTEYQQLFNSGKKAVVDFLKENPIIEPKRVKIPA